MAHAFTDVSRLFRAQWPIVVDNLLQRAAAEEIHPNSHLAADLRCTVDLDDVRMIELGEELSLTDHCTCPRCLPVRCEPQPLQRHLAREFRVPRPINLTERASTDAFKHPKRSPWLASFRVRGQTFRSAREQLAKRTHRRFIFIGAMFICDSGEQFELTTRGGTWRFLDVASQSLRIFPALGCRRSRVWCRSFAQIVIVRCRRRDHSHVMLRLVHSQAHSRW